MCEGVYVGCVCGYVCWGVGCGGVCVGGVFMGDGCKYM